MEPNLCFSVSNMVGPVPVPYPDPDRLQHNFSKKKILPFFNASSSIVAQESCPLIFLFYIVLTFVILIYV